MESIKGLQVDEYFTNAYGESSIPEKVLQKIWLKQNFIKEGLKTFSGKSLTIRNPGTWNHLEGPDFKNAEIEIDGKWMHGDVEVHFHAEDWHNHAHEFNKNYSNVILHVVLFEPKEDIVAPYNTFGYCPEIVVLLDKLYTSIEEYAAEDLMSELAGNYDPISALEGFLVLPEKDQAILLREKAKIRWRQKRGFAYLRLKKYSFEEALHIGILETLGYKRNRAAMSDIALRYPPVYFIEKGPEKIFEEFKYQWALRGVRPQNHPLKRLKQYAGLLEKNTNYAKELVIFLETLSFGSSNTNTASYRKTWHFSHLRQIFQENIFQNEIKSTRLDTLITDAIFPLFSAKYNQDFFDLWFHWYSGDIPLYVEHARTLLKYQDIRSNGQNQGLLQLMI